MKPIIKLIQLSICALIISACSTTGYVVIPEGSDLYINKRPASVQKDGKVTTKPYFWDSVEGVPYRIEKNNETIKEGTLDTKFRATSIFWPPYAIIYRPLGLDSKLTYDLVNDNQRYRKTSN